MEEILLGFGKRADCWEGAVAAAGKRKNIVVSLIDHALNLPTGSGFLSARNFSLMFRRSCRPAPQ